MAKALKTVALVVGAAALIATGVGAVAFGSIAAISVAGISTGTLLLASSVLSAAAAFLTKPPSVPSSQTSRLNASVDPRAFRKTVLGSTAMATDIRYEEWSGKDQDYCDWIICLASHAIDGVDEIWLDDKLAWSAGVVQGKFGGYFSVPNIVLEGSPANAFTFASGQWNGAHRLTGCAYLRMRFKVTGIGKKGESPFASGPTQRMTIVGRGARLYDPRRDSTVGGSGPMRANDQSTWRYTTDDGAVIGENLPLQILRVLLGWRITNPVTGVKRVATGAGMPVKRLNLTSFMVAAALAEELVNRSTGSPEPRYAGAGVISEGDDPKTTLDALCAGCLGRFLDTGGRLSLTLAHNDLAEMATDDGLLTDDVVGPFTWDPDPALEQTPNVLRGRYVDATPASLYQLIDYPEVRIDSPDGMDRIMSLDLGMVESASQAQRIAKQVLQRKQYQRSFTAPFDIRAWAYPVGKIVPFTFAPLGFVRRPMRVVEQEYGQGGVCNMTLREEAQQIYAWDKDDSAPVQAVRAIVYDPTKAAIIQALNEVAQRGAHQIIAQSVEYPVTPTATSLTIVAFRATIDDGRVIDLPAGRIDGLTNASSYRLFYAIEDAQPAFTGADGQAFTGAEDQTFTGIIPAGSYYAAPADSLLDPANPAFVVIRMATTANADGTSFPPPAPAPAGDGGGGYGGGGRFQQNVALQ